MSILKIFTLLFIISFDSQAQYEEDFSAEAGAEAKLMGGNCVVSSGASGPCIGIIIREPKKKQFYIGHFFAESNRKSFKLMVKKAIRDLGPASTLEVFVTGSSGTPGLSDRPLIKDRFFVEKLLEENGFLEKKTKIAWLPKDHTGWIILDNNTGSAILYYNYFNAVDEDPDDLKEINLRRMKGKYPKGMPCSF